MDTGATDLADLGRQLAAIGTLAYIRALLRRDGDGWVLHHAWALIGAEPPDWVEQTWRYERLAFVACNNPAADLASLCAAAAGGGINLGGMRAAVPTALNPAQWNRRPSFSRHDRVLLPFPVTDFAISAADQSSRYLNHEMLAGASCPSFPEPNSAWRAFAEGEFSLSGAQAPPNELAQLRIASDEAWIGPVHVTPTELTVDVRGRAVAGCELELFGVTGRKLRELDAPGLVTLPLESGLPKSAWLWLKRGTAWLDYRSIDAGSGWTGELDRAGVQIEIPVEPQANVEALLAAGEGTQVEYKRHRRGHAS